MQDEVNEKVVSLCISGGKISARILKNVLMKYLLEVERREKQRAEKSAAKGDPDTSISYRGKISMEQLKAEKKELSNIEITDKNIKSFEKYARKYEVDYCLKKDCSMEPPRYYVFFGAKDESSMTAAFKEYTGWQLKKSKKISVRKKLSLAKERQAKHREREKNRQKERGPEH